MVSLESTSTNVCTMCHGRGFWRDPKRFFYGICLLACGGQMLFQWTPAPHVFMAVWRLVAYFSLPDAVGTALIFCLTAFPPLFGAWFLIAWRRQGICPQCRLSP